MPWKEKTMAGEKEKFADVRVGLEGSLSDGEREQEQCQDSDGGVGAPRGHRGDTKPDSGENRGDDDCACDD